MTGSPGWRFAVIAAGAVIAMTSWLLAARLTRDAPRWQQRNFRGRTVSRAGGPAVCTALVLGLLGFLVAEAAGVGGDPIRGGRRVALAALVVASAAGVVGVLDDLYGDTAAKGFRGHLRALRRGRPSSGLGKLVVIVAAAFAGALVLGDGDVGWQQLVDTGVIAASANLANLLDLRPGRALKVILAVAIPVTLLADPAVGVVSAWPVGVAAGSLPADLGERALLGDGGANALGGSLGVMVAAAGGLAVSSVALVGLVLATGISEFVSYSAIIERSAPLRWADGLGRQR